MKRRMWILFLQAFVVLAVLYTAGTIALGETRDRQDEIRGKLYGINITLPAGWTFKEASDFDFVCQSNSEIDGDVAYIGAAPGKTAREIAEEYRAVYGGDNVRDYTIGGMPAAYYFKSTPDYGTEAHFFVINGDQQLMISIYAPSDEQYKSVAQDIDFILKNFRFY